MCSCAENAKMFAILFENNLILKTSQQNLVKGAWASSQPVAVPSVSHSGSGGPVSILERSGFGLWSAN